MEYKLKKDYLTRSESKAIIANSMKNFFDTENNIINGLNFNFLDMDERFFDSLGLFCIEDYNDEIKEAIYNEGKEEELLESITNAADTYEMLYYIAEKASSIDNSLFELLKNFGGENNYDEIEKVMPQLQDAFKKYDEITRKTNNEGTTIGK